MEKLYYSIGEVADMMKVSVSLVRFWSNSFSRYVKPKRNAKGNRLYRAEDVDALKQIPEVVECHYTTGKYAMFIKIYAKDNKHLLRIILEKLSVIPGVEGTETFQISLDEIFRRQLSVFDVDVNVDVDETDEEEL